VDLEDPPDRGRRRRRGRGPSQGRRPDAALGPGGRLPRRLLRRRLPVEHRPQGPQGRHRRHRVGLPVPARPRRRRGLERPGGLVAGAGRVPPRRVQPGHRTGLRRRGAHRAPHHPLPGRAPPGGGRHADGGHGVPGHRRPVERHLPLPGHRPLRRRLRPHGLLGLRGAGSGDDRVRRAAGHAQAGPCHRPGLRRRSRGGTEGRPERHRDGPLPRCLPPQRGHGRLTVGLAVDAGRAVGRPHQLHVVAGAPPATRRSASEEKRRCL
ncbi:MAG: hypothetical protein AVDCRST_MAG10-3610, partial [uncultured Acidimicrobiales bacterium]